MVHNIKLLKLINKANIYYGDDVYRSNTKNKKKYIREKKILGYRDV